MDEGAPLPLNLLRAKGKCFLNASVSLQEVEEMVSRGLGWEVVRLLSWEEQTGSRVRPKPVPSTPLRS